MTKLRRAALLGRPATLEAAGRYRPTRPAGIALGLLVALAVSAFLPFLGVTSPARVNGAGYGSGFSPEVIRMASAEENPRLAERTAPLPFFGIYPGGGTGETPGIPVPADGAVDQRLAELAAGSPIVVHLYTAWSWHSDEYLDSQIRRQTEAGRLVTLTVKYSPPNGHEGDVAGYESFVRAIVNRYAANPGVVSYVIGNEANQTGSPDASDGPFREARAAVAGGTIAARSELDRLGSPADVGVNFALRSVADNSGFLQDLADRGGPAFPAAVKFVGVNVYPGIWEAGSGDPATDMLRTLETARASVDGSPALRGRPLEIREVGAPLVDDADQVRRLDAFVKTALDNRTRLGIRHLNWFDLWDADSRSANQFYHYGLLRSDLSPKPAFAAFREFVRVEAASH